MSYETMQAGLQTIIRGMAEYADVQVTLGDWDILTQGHLVAVVLEYGGVEIEYEAMGGSDQFTWTVLVHLYGRYTTDSETTNRMRDHRNVVLEELLKFPRLNGTAGCLNANPVSGGWAEVTSGSGAGGGGTVEIGGLTFLHEIIEEEITEVRIVALSE